jgi:hypothetical protein
MATRANVRAACQAGLALREGMRYAPWILVVELEPGEPSGTRRPIVGARTPARLGLGARAVVPPRHVTARVRQCTSHAGRRTQGVPAESGPQDMCRCGRPITGPAVEQGRGRAGQGLVHNRILSKIAGPTSPRRGQLAEWGACAERALQAHEYCPHGGRWVVKPAHPPHPELATLASEAVPSVGHARDGHASHLPAQMSPPDPPPSARHSVRPITSCVGSTTELPIPRRPSLAFRTFAEIRRRTRRSRLHPPPSEVHPTGTWECNCNTDDAPTPSRR